MLSISSAYIEIYWNLNLTIYRKVLIGKIFFKLFQRDTGLLKNMIKLSSDIFFVYWLIFYKLTASVFDSLYLHKLSYYFIKNFASKKKYLYPIKQKIVYLELFSKNLPWFILLNISWEVNCITFGCKKTQLFLVFAITN